jgi:glycosyltransferase involved in cell wall biosynthesis
MLPSDVTVVSCLYGSSHDDFLGDWLSSVKKLEPAPREVLIATDRYRHLTDGCIEVFRRRHGWKYPQAFHLNTALEQVKTKWVWQLDIDDIAFPGALAGINDHGADVVQMGYKRSDGEIHLPQWGGPINQYVAGSIVRAKAIRHIGGFRDVEHQDSDLWERLIEAGTVFASADRPRFLYRRHAQARTEREAHAVT